MTSDKFTRPRTATKLNEAKLSQVDTRAVFKYAAQIRSKPSIFGKLFKKSDISVDDLNAAWKSAGYPDDTADIAEILKDAGFNGREIRKVFSDIFGQGDNGPADPIDSPEIAKLVKRIQDMGLVDDIKQFMAKEYEFKESFNYGKARIDDLKSIFSTIVNEERHNREYLIKKHEQTSLGRSRK